MSVHYNVHDFQRPQTLASQIYEHLRNEVLTGSLEPGQWLKEQEIATTLNVSRTPVREAVRRLAQDGLLDIVENRGVRVRELTLKEAVDTYEVRELLEGMAAHRAALTADDQAVERLETLLARINDLPPEDSAAQIQADDALHELIAKTAGNQTLLDVIKLLNGRVTRIKILTRDTNTSDTTRQHHHEIVEAIAAGDPERAQAAMRSHIQLYRQVVENRLREIEQEPGR